MGKNTGKGGKYFRKSKNLTQAEKRQMIYKEEGQEYAQVKKMLGNGRCEIYCFDGRTRIGHIRGSMHKRIWICVDDIILVSLRDYQDEKADIIHKYTAEEGKALQQYGEVKLNFQNDFSSIYDDDVDEMEDVDFDDI
tara:strand:- start:60 stop:470 length:411 start_codon:yes stop_codon:yes gene_type:complete